MGDLLTTGSVLAAFLAGGVALFAPCCIVFLAPSYLAVAVEEPALAPVAADLRVRGRPRPRPGADHAGHQPGRVRDRELPRPALLRGGALMLALAALSLSGG